jgi:DNA-binding NarL/FixJ family response regulator
MIKILIVDDQATVRKGLRMQLSLEADLKVVGEAENGSMALEAIPILNPDLIILDLEMPIMDGLSTLEILRKHYPDMPVVMLSIHDWPEDRAHAQAEGVSAFIVKSGNPSELITEIHRVVNQQN